MNSFRMKLRRHTKKRRFNKKSRRFKSNRKMTKRRFKTQNKKYRLNMKGGVVFKGTDQGCSFWPSIYPPNEINNQTVTKVFYNKSGGQTNALQNEDAGYDIFDSYDNEYLFHARKISSGLCLTQILQSTECENDPGYRIIVPKTTNYATTTYINTEYVGVSLKYEQIKSKLFKIQLITFFIGLLHLRSATNCLIFSDLNGGNICYMRDDKTNECRFKCIDVGGVFELTANQMVEEIKIRDINNQFINIRSLVLEGLQNITIQPEFAYNNEINYENNLAIEIQKLQVALTEITNTDETLLFKKQLREITTNVLSRPQKKSKLFNRGNSDDEEGPHVEFPRFNNSSNMFDD